MCMYLHFSLFIFKGDCRKHAYGWSQAGMADHRVWGEGGVCQPCERCIRQIWAEPLES